MMRLVIDIYDGEDAQGTKEAVAMLLEPLAASGWCRSLLTARRKSGERSL